MTYKPMLRLVVLYFTYSIKKENETEVEIRRKKVVCGFLGEKDA